MDARLPTVERPLIKDPYLAAAVEAQIDALPEAKREIARQAVAEIAVSGFMGTFDELVRRYRRAIRHAIDPDRKIVRGATIDRAIMKDPYIAAGINRELGDVTQKELDRANAAVREIQESAAAVTVVSGDPRAGQERIVTHPASKWCQVRGDHLATACGYFKTPEQWLEVYRAAVLEVLAG